MASPAAVVAPALVLLLATASAPSTQRSPFAAPPPPRAAAAAAAGAPPTRAATSAAPFAASAPSPVGRWSGPVVQPRGPWAWPLAPRPKVLRPFIAPASRWGPGHRGVDLAGGAGQPVHAVAAGTVSHVGTIAGRGTVSVLHVSGLRSTYEPVDPSVRLGEVVHRGTVLGTVTRAASHCSPAACLHLGALRGERYLDPMVLLLGGRVRLLPVR